MAVIQVKTDTFQQEVLESIKPVLVDFYADWCGPCKMVAPIVASIAEENETYKVCKVNVDDSPEIAAQFGIMSIPTLIAFKEGKVVNKMIGAQGKAQILDLLK